MKNNAFKLAALAAVLFGSLAFSGDASAQCGRGYCRTVCTASAPRCGFFGRLFGFCGSSCGYTYAPTTCGRVATSYRSTCSSGSCAFQSYAPSASACTTCAGGSCTIAADGPKLDAQAVEQIAEAADASGVPSCLTCGEFAPGTCEEGRKACAVAASISEAEAALLAAVRSIRGDSIALDSNLSAWARYNSQLCAGRGAVGHFTGSPCFEIASPGRSAQDAIRLWLNSGGHRQLLLGGFTRCGVGCCASSNGQTFWTVRFE